MKTILILASSLLLGSCSFFINKIDSTVLEKERIKIERPYVATYCYNEKPNLQLVGTNRDAQLQYQNFLKGKNYSFVDKVILWSLIQFQIRPDLSSPTARLQYVIRHQNEIFYFDFFSEEARDNILTSLAQIIFFKSIKLKSLFSGTQTNLIATSFTLKQAKAWPSF